MDPEREIFPVRGETDEIIPGTAATYLKQWLADRVKDSGNFRTAVEQLVGAGADPVRIAWLLAALANAHDWRGISRDELRQISKDLGAAADGLKQLFFSQVNQILELTSRELEGKLVDLATRTEELAPKAHARRPMGQDLVRATIVHYVKETTGKFHDDAVSVLIEAAESSKAEEPEIREGYTQEAHIAWRNRSSCKGLLEGPSEELKRLLQWMDEDLKTL
jgi:hypothetical protein